MLQIIRMCRHEGVEDLLVEYEGQFTWGPKSQVPSPSMYAHESQETIEIWLIIMKVRS